VANLNNRLLALENIINTAPMLTIDVVERPTSEQRTLIERCANTGRRLLVFYEPGNTAWMPGFGVPPWEESQHVTR